MALVVLNSSPTDNQRDLAVTSPIYVTFNKALDMTSLTDIVFNLVRKEQLIPVDASIEFRLALAEGAEVETFDLLQVVITPTSKLYMNHEYRLYVKGGSRGVMADDGEYLLHDFILNFTTGGAVVALPEDNAAPEDIYQGSELSILFSQPIADAIMVTGNKVQLTFNQGIPDVTNISVEAKHPMGYPLDGADPWSANATIAITGHVATIQPADTSIAFSANLIYSFKVYHPTNKLIPEVEFMTALSPFYSTVEEIRLEYGQASQDLSDYELALHVFKQSMQAKAVWSGGTNTVPSATPFYLAEYVRYKVLQQLMKDIQRNNRSTGAKKTSIGDLRVELRDIDPEAIVDINGYVRLYAAKVASGDLGTIPLDASDPGYAVIAERGAQAYMGSANDLRPFNMSRRLPGDPRGN